ncbi:MAG: hypothetical protein IM504_10475 [Microcystis sp. M038S2]|jgi:hypothetical protein|uniref:Sugar O-methyltransferase n=1 Tax=Microcystis aeruginosa G11-04 TaxID=2685956 RepID=A0A966FYG6_MICAE|nr:MULTISPECIES: hypothetical protein [unclassified Microcystis]NCR26172.1 hypothetical protein [Microcystis aeruginosa LE13-04]NCS39516.1 hypothetical protein [Microcystis aeruginosa BS13-10]NCS56726.1 hypothetical protein [Microcystis aeruginosa G11-04]NCT42571.1 hypothetical protein [Microcystis aeruginosa G11-09]TRU56153.1 MAG: hypothetical protein EWV48_20840 [Microcystis aeruginosa Ma_QC_C_20070823_S13]TRU61641.1 MAG: hypothetical protein EWV56_08640 [Microcystis aeruginosa Ma_QC_C_2007
MNLIVRKLNSLKRKMISKSINNYKAPKLDFVDNLIEEMNFIISDSKISEAWRSYGDEIISSLKENNPSEFLRFPRITGTVHPNQFGLSFQYLNYIFSSDKFTAAIQNALTESPVGNPFLDPSYPLSSPLLVQHGYHLIRLLEYTNIDVLHLQEIVEFGGGYGSFFRLLKNLGYTNKYFIYDLPVMCAIQKFYLKNVFLPCPNTETLSNLKWLSGAASNVSDNVINLDESLFMATWSLSECPYDLRQEFEPIISKFKYVLIAYQPKFHDFNNVEYFNSLESKLPNFKWNHFECPIYENMFYLIGKKI